MGFMDKAKKLAEQAQEKLDEAQKSFNKSQTPDSPAGEAVRHDEHGRPIAQEETPAAATAPPSATPGTEEPGTEEEQTPAAATEPPSATPAQAEEKTEGAANTTPDPFKPIQ